MPLKLLWSWCRKMSTPRRHIVIPIFIPHRGCPFDCIYCNQKSISGQTEEMTVQTLETTVDLHLRTVPRDSHVEIGFYGGSFTGLDREQQLRFLRAAHKYIEAGLVREIRLSTRPDYINEDILEYLKEYGVGTVELGVQSMDEEVLAKSCRGHDVRDVLNACALVRLSGIRLGIQTMLGLPGDTRQKSIDTAHAIIDLKPELVRIYPTLVIKGTYLEELHKRGEYHPLSLEEAVDISAELMEIYEAASIRVIRLGLQPTEEIREGGEIAAGPFHPAFRQLAESRRLLKNIQREILQKGLDSFEGLLIKTKAGNLSNVIGQRKCNIKLLSEGFGFRRIKVLADESVDGCEISGL